MGKGLRERLSRGGLIVAPGVYDMISVRIADRMGFDVLYMTGYGTVASYSVCPMRGSRRIPTWSPGFRPWPGWPRRR